MMAPSDTNEDLIRLWKDCEALVSYDLILYQYSWSHIQSQQADQCQKLFSQFPQLQRVLQAWWICGKACDPPLALMPSLFSICLLLDIPWNEMCHACIRPLGNNLKQIPALLATADVTAPCSTLTINLARGCLRVLKSIETGALPRLLWSVEMLGYS
jgi:hypothetical protein